MVYAVMLQFCFFNDTATTEIYTLSLHDALPICRLQSREPALELRARGDEEDDDAGARLRAELRRERRRGVVLVDRKSTRLNSSHANISYAVFCLKKKNSTTRIVSYLTITSLPYQ